MSVMSVRLSEQLEALAEATGRTKSFLAAQAIRDFLNREAWQVAEIQQAIVEADEGDFVSNSEMMARFKMNMNGFTKRARKLRPNLPEKFFAW